MFHKVYEVVLYISMQFAMVFFVLFISLHLFQECDTFWNCSMGNSPVTINETSGLFQLQSKKNNSKILENVT